MKVSFATLLVLGSAAIASAATCGVLGKPSVSGMQLMGTFNAGKGKASAECKVTTAAPTTAAPATTKANATAAPATKAATTAAATTAAATTAAATTAAATTAAATTAAATTAAATTKATKAPATAAPVTKAKPTVTKTTNTRTTKTGTKTTTTKAPKTTAPKTAAPTTTAAKTAAPTTTQATTAAKTAAPTTTAAKTAAPTTKATTVAPATAAPNKTAATTSASCAKSPCAAPMLSTDPACSAIAAGSKKECALMNNKVVTACVGTKASYSCPANNANAKLRPDFVTEQAVKCKPCSAKVTVTDLDTDADKYWVGLEWGPLMSTQGEFVETDVTSYSVHIVDSHGRILETVGTAPKVDSTTTCCTKDLYSYSAVGTLPAGYSRFMIVPNINANAWLPMGILTNPIIDKASGEATKYIGSFTIKVSNAELFKTDPKINMALREAVADTLSGVEKENVRITNISTVARRLSQEPGRMLAKHLAGSVKVDYEIVLPDTYTGGPIKKASFAPKTLMAAINTRVAAKGIKGATVTEEPVIGEVSTKTIGRPMATGDAYRSVPLGFLAALVGLSATMGIFC